MISGSSHPLVFGFWVQTPLHSFNPQLLLGRVHVEERFGAQVQFLKTRVVKQVNNVGDLTTEENKFFNKLSLTQEHKYPGVLCHSRATAQECCLETDRSRSMSL